MRQGGNVASVGALLAVMLVASACGASPTANSGSGGAGEKSAYAKYEKLKGAERTQRLLKEARKGKALTVYTSNTDIDDLVTAFEKKYSGVKVKVYRANSETVLQRVSQEASAGKSTNDIVDTNDVELDTLSRQHVLAPYQGPATSGLRKDAIFKNWTASRFNAFVIGWNTHLVPKGKEPKSIEELAGKSWHGKLSMELGDWDWYVAWHTYLTDEKGMSDAEVDRLFTRLAKNSKVVKGHTVQGELLSSGQFSVAMSIYSHTVDKAAADGAPVAWRPAVEPVILRPNGLGLMAKPKHPAAALLWMDWVLTGGQKVIAGAKRIPAAKSSTTTIPAGTETYDVPLRTLRTQSKKWETAYDALLRHARKGG